MADRRNNKPDKRGNQDNQRGGRSQSSESEEGGNE